MLLSFSEAGVNARRQISSLVGQGWVRLVVLMTKQIHVKATEGEGEVRI